MEGKGKGTEGGVGRKIQASDMQSLDIIVLFTTKPQYIHIQH